MRSAQGALVRNLKEAGLHPLCFQSVEPGRAGERGLRSFLRERGDASDQFLLPVWIEQSIPGTTLNAGAVSSFTRDDGFAVSSPDRITSSVRLPLPESTGAVTTFLIPSSHGMVSGPSFAVDRRSQIFDVLARSWPHGESRRFPSRKPSFAYRLPRRTFQEP